MHGSAYFKLLDDAAFFAAQSREPEVFVLTTAFTTYLTRPVSTGVMRARGRVLNQNSSQFIVEAVLHDGGGNQLGRGSGIVVRGKLPLVKAAGYADDAAPRQLGVGAAATSNPKNSSRVAGPVPRLSRAATGLFLGAAAYASWGLLSPVGKILLEHFPPMTLNAVRLSLATIALAFVLPRSAWVEGVQLLRRPALAVLLVFGVGVQFTLFLYAVTLVDATYATLAFFTAPLWTALVARARLGERLGALFGPTVALMFAGGWLALFGLAPLPAGFNWLGIALAVAAGVGWAVYAVGLKELAPDVPLRPLMAASFLANSAYFVVGALVVEGIPAASFWASLPPSTVGWMAIYVAIPTTLSLFLFAAALQRAPASGVNLLVGMELAATAVFAYLLLGDTFDSWQLLGLAIVMGAVTAYLWQQSQQKTDAPAAHEPTLDVAA